MDNIHASRILMGDSLGFHIIFVLFGLTLPVLVFWFEWMSIRRKDDRLRQQAKFWSKIMALLVITGVLSGTAIALQMSLVWPGILKFGGEVIGLPFMFETYAFLVEAIFLGAYMMTWDKPRVSQKLHLFLGGMVVLGSTASAYAITSINGWMNLPTGFDIVNGKFENIDVVAAMFSKTALITFVHSMFAYYVAGGLFIAGLYAFRLLRTKTSNLNQKKHQFDYFIIQKLLLFVMIALTGSIITADLTGKYLAKDEPTKLAAIELHYESGSNAPLILGGVSDGNGGVVGPHIKIPNALSILACNTPGCSVAGIYDTPEDKRPPLVVHTFFDIKMTLIGFVTGALVIYFAARKWRPSILRNKTMLAAFVFISWFGLAIVELGWMMTEIGRQPWAVRGYVTTEEAVTKTHNISSFGFIFPLIYALLFATTFVAIRLIIKSEKANPKGVL